MINLRVLLLVGRYLPGFKAGGPIRTTAGLVEALGDEFDFKIITQDRDLHDEAAYEGIIADKWTRVGKADVLYLSPRNRTICRMRRLLIDTPHDVMYLTGFFSASFSIWPIWLRHLSLVPVRPTIVGPHGEFAQGALALKSLKKQAYLGVAKMLGAYKNVLWRASSDYEAVDIRRQFGTEVGITTARDLSPTGATEQLWAERNQKNRGEIKIVFLSRIARMKNLDFALTVLRGLQGRVNFNIIGPMEDKPYWAVCEQLIAELPSNITVNYLGAVEHRSVHHHLSQHDIFLLPTRGENHGHVIIEAMRAGCPVVISDRTQWRGLRLIGVGWDLPLDSTEGFRSALQECIDMDHDEFAALSSAARHYGLSIGEDPVSREQNRQMFLSAGAQANAAP